MAVKRLLAGLTLMLAVLTTPACRSRDERAATAAGIAADALQQGDINTARVQIGLALAARDDNGDYWLLSGRIALAENNFPVAFNAFESALALDQTNIEALTRLCQLAVSVNQADRAERYADQLATLHPGDKTALNVQAALALSRGDKAKATTLLDQILTGDPADEAALITRSRLLSSSGDYAGAARAAEASLAGPGDPEGRLTIVKEAYLKGGDAAGYRRTIARLANAAPRSAAAQLDYAQSLYDTGDRVNGFAVTRQALALRPGDVAMAESVLHMWLAQGTAAMPAGAIVASAENGVPETKAAFAAYANAIGRPDLALRALGTAGLAEPPGIAVNNAKVARAQAQALLGRRDGATRGVETVLLSDPDQPRALALRGVLRASTGDRRGGVEDLRHALSDDPANASARLALVDVLLATGEGVLAEQTLRDALGGGTGIRADPRLATRLARLLRATGRAADATAVLTDYTRTNMFAPRPPD